MNASNPVGESASAKARCKFPSAGMLKAPTLTWSLGINSKSEGTYPKPSHGIRALVSRANWNSIHEMGLAVSLGWGTSGFEVNRALQL